MYKMFIVTFLFFIFDLNIKHRKYKEYYKENIGLYLPYRCKRCRKYGVLRTDIHSWSVFMVIVQM